MENKTKITNNVKKLIKEIEKNSSRISMILLVLLLVVFLISTSYSLSIGKVIGEKAEDAREYAIPSQLQLSIINCNGCYEVLDVVESIKKQNVEITNEEELSIYDNRAKELIDKYNIQTLPTILVFGEINNNKTNFNNFNKVNDAMILAKTSPPYLDTLSNQLKGVVSLIEITDSSCEECISLNPIPASFGQVGVIIGDWEKIEYDSAEGRNLIKGYDIKQVPVMLFSENIMEYEGMEDIFKQLGSINKKGFYTVHSILPPFRNLTTEKIEGIISLITLIDESCSNCYDAGINKQILQGFGMTIGNEETHDISSAKGKQLISKYNIDKVPMILVSPAGSIYSSFVQAWASVGTVDDDGWFVMRTPENIGEVTTIN